MELVRGWQAPCRHGYRLVAAAGAPLMRGCVGKEVDAPGAAADAAAERLRHGHADPPRRQVNDDALHRGVVCAASCAGCHQTAAAGSGERGAAATPAHRAAAQAQQTRTAVRHARRRSVRGLNCCLHAPAGGMRV